MTEHFKEKRMYGWDMISIAQMHFWPQLLPEGNLTIVCDLTVLGPEVTQSGSKFPDEKLSPVDNSLKEMSEQFGTLFDNKRFSDVKIRCEKRGIPLPQNHFVRTIFGLRCHVPVGYD